MKDECLICGAPLKYLENDDLMECVVCHKKESSKTVCENGHYICNECHTQGMDSIIGVCLAEKSKAPIVIIKNNMTPVRTMRFERHNRISMGHKITVKYAFSLTI